MRQIKTAVQHENKCFYRISLIFVKFEFCKEFVVNSYLLVVYSVHIAQNNMLFHLEHSFTEE